MNRVGSLETRLEGAWGDLTSKPQTLYLLQRAGAFLITSTDKGDNRGAVPIGTYTRQVTLADFRADVFATLESIRP